MKGDTHIRILLENRDLNDAKLVVEGFGNGMNWRRGGMRMNSGFDEEVVKLELTRRLGNLSVSGVAMKPPSG